METGERLAAYLSGDLDTDERTALEAELGRDAALRSRLERIEAADTALAELDDVELPEGFSDRLHAAVDAELDRTLGDELAARRARRAQRSRRWVPAFGAAAAVAAVIAVGAGVVLSGPGGDDADTAADGDRGPAIAGSLEADDEAAEMDDGAGADALTGAAPEAAPVGPTIVANGRALTTDDLESLTGDPRFDPSAARVATAEDAAETAAAYRRALTVTTTTAESGQDAGDGEAAAAPPVRFEGDVTPADRKAVADCLAVLDADAPVIPLYAELGTDADGREVVVYAALSAGAEGAYDRVEVWMVARDDCRILQFVQQTR